jgi:hypothetical protein
VFEIATSHSPQALVWGLARTARISINRFNGFRSCIDIRDIRQAKETIEMVPRFRRTG